jgi:hypothetical protein
VKDSRKSIGPGGRHYCTSTRMRWGDGTVERKDAVCPLDRAIHVGARRDALRGIPADLRQLISNECVAIRRRLDISDGSSVLVLGDQVGDIDSLMAQPRSSVLLPRLLDGRGGERLKRIAGHLGRLDIGKYRVNDLVLDEGSKVSDCAILLDDPLEICKLVAHVAQGTCPAFHEDANLTYPHEHRRAIARFDHVGSRLVELEIRSGTMLPLLLGTEMVRLFHASSHLTAPCGGITQAFFDEHIKSARTAKGRLGELECVSTGPFGIVFDTREGQFRPASILRCSARLEASDLSLLQDFFTYA